MIAKKSLFLAMATLVCAADAGSAQSRRDGPLFRRVTEPLRTVALDLRTGELTRGPRVTNRAVTTASSLRNNDHSGFVAVDSGNASCEWWDAANKGGGTQARRIGGLSGLMTGFSFAYCSAELDPKSFGFGGSAIISFRDGYVRGTAANSHGPSGTLVATFALSGLPANTAGSSFFGGFNCYQLSVSLATPICFGGDGAGPPEPNVAWAWRFMDLGTDGILAATFPFMSCVASCTDGPGSLAPGVPGFDGLGMIDRVDQYCPVGSVLSSFQFGTTPFGGYFTSISMAVREASISSRSNTVLAATANVHGQGPAPISTVTHQAVGIAPSFSFDCSAATANRPAVFRVGFGPASAKSSKFGTIWVPLAGFQGFNVNLGNHAQAVVNVAGQPLPKDLTIACLRVSFQGFCGDDPIGYVSNGLDGIVNVAPLR